MTEDQALDEIKVILNKRVLSSDDIDYFLSLEQFVSGYIFGDLFEALYVICPKELIGKLSGAKP